MKTDNTVIKRHKIIDINKIQNIDLKEMNSDLKKQLTIIQNHCVKTASFKFMIMCYICIFLVLLYNFINVFYLTWLHVLRYLCWNITWFKFLWFTIYFYFLFFIQTYPDDLVRFWYLNLVCGCGLASLSRADVYGLFPLIFFFVIFLLASILSLCCYFPELLFWFLKM